jgi:hypothetical protein
MLRRKSSLQAPRCLVLLCFLLAGAPCALYAQQAPQNERPQEPAQQPAPAPDAAAPPVAPNAEGGAPAVEERKPPVHRFWDQQNCWLFAGVLGARYLDFASTLNARRRGLDEVLLTNEIVDNHGAFAAIEFAGAAASVGVSYLFHRGGHHKLERWTSYIHISVAVFGSVRNFALKTPHPPPAAPAP